MNVTIVETSEELGRLSGKACGEIIRQAILQKGYANIILATGASQFATLNQLIREENIDWGKVNMFHLDEYIGLPESHPASFRKYLSERFLAKVPALNKVFLINGETDAEAEIKELGSSISSHPIDVALVGIGENGHLAFNDPPADFNTEKPYLIVNLDEPCRIQQMNEGWFATLDEVPVQAISMSVKQIMKSKHIICSVPDERKALAVKNTFTEDISNLFPASILRNHPNCQFFLDKYSSGLLSVHEMDSL